MFPLYDENSTIRTPIATYIIIAVNAAMWIFLQGMGGGEELARSLCHYALIPGELLNTAPAGTAISVGRNMECVLDGGGNWFTLFTSMFMHGSWFHIISNMWFLWVFGDNIEDAMGPFRFIAFYLLCGLAAAAAQIMTDPNSVLPMVGASGAIGGVMGAYARLYPKAHVVTLVILVFYITTISLPAVVMLGYWFFLQLISGIPALQSAEGGVAFWAHIGGFVAGIILVSLMYRQDYLEAHRAQARRRSARHRFF